MPNRIRSAELAALTSIAAQVNCTQDLDEILLGALATTLEVIGEDTGEVFLLDAETGTLKLYAHRGLSDGFVADEAVVGVGECLCGLAVRSGQTLRIDDMAGHPARTRTACLREGFASCIRLPLRARGEVLGLLNIQSRGPRVFTAEDEELLTAIGNQIGIAIANAQLIDDAEQRRATLDSVMDSLVDGLILLDRRGRITYVNPCAATMLDLPPTMLLGHTIQAVEHHLASRVADPEQISGRLQAVTGEAGGGELATEVTLMGHPSRTLQARSFGIKDASSRGHGSHRLGQSLGLGFLLHDITRERELDRLKSQLLSTVSHELRTPLASIKGFATTLLRRDVQWDEDTRREFLAIIDEESDRLSELIGNLLDMSRVEAGTLRVEPEPTDVRPIIQETMAEFRMMLRREHRFRAKLAASLPMVWADPRRVRQVVRNLVENAVKYSPGGGQVSIAAEVVEGFVQVSVSDEGIGIEPEYIRHVFDRFYQVDSASTRQVGGSGLGLSICKAIVEAHNGRIWVESVPGVGSTFRFTLPLAEQK